MVRRRVEEVEGLLGEGCVSYSLNTTNLIMHLVSTSLNLLGPSGVNHPLPYLDACGMLRLCAALCWLPMHWMLYWLWPIDPCMLARCTLVCAYGMYSYGDRGRVVLLPVVL